MLGYLPVNLTEDDVKREDLKYVIQKLKGGEDNKPKVTDDDMTGGYQFRKDRSKLHEPLQKLRKRRQSQ
jgi:hypothetical protein